MADTDRTADDRTTDTTPGPGSPGSPESRDRDSTCEPAAGDSFDVIVIGAGPAGTAAALRAAELGANVAVVEADRLGGTCVNTGCVPTRVLAKAARLMREVHAAHSYGIEVSAPTIDWPTTVARVEERVDLVRSIKREAERFDDAGVTLILEGRAKFTGAHTLELESGRALRGESIIVCVGGHSKRLPVPGNELATVPEDVLRLAELPKRIAIIGAGNTGAQLVTVFDAFGSEVTLLDVAPRILMASDAAISETVTASFRARGVRVHTGIDTVSGLSRASDGSITLLWRDDDAPQSSSFDVVVMATGWPADIDDLGLESAGVERERASIPVDEHFRTGVSHIFAVGDTTGRDMLVQAAQFEGEAAAENAVLGSNRRTPHHLLPAGGFTDPDYAGVGFTEEQARERDEQCVTSRIDYADLDRAVIDDREAGFLLLIADRRRELILGAHAVGETAVEVIQSVTTAMAAGVDVATLAKVKFAYPTYAAIIGMAARALLQGSDDPTALD
ncbi:dihydrolipoyl dehydrogenase family protein [Marisediminicola sp. LYQ85]|uniref:dihydrolipoyl dehydrogenase family protein n=1 Tax=Marisediminicola sp. LYQ85 TaxID=3391062 RepID=UPI003983CF8E